jgi:hypothetical protein
MNWSKTENSCPLCKKKFSFIEKYSKVSTYWHFYFESSWSNPYSSIRHFFETEFSETQGEKTKKRKRVQIAERRQADSLYSNQGIAARWNVLPYLFSNVSREGERLIDRLMFHYGDNRRNGTAGAAASSSNILSALESSSSERRRQNAIREAAERSRADYDRLRAQMVWTSTVQSVYHQAS